MASDLTVPICLARTVLLVLFCTVACVTNALLLVVLYKDPLKCFRKPIVVYITALALLDLLSGSVTGPGVTYNHIICVMGQDESPVLSRSTRFVAISAEFTICTANFIALLLSVERLLAVAFPILYRRKSSVRRSIVCLCCVVLYTLSVSLANLSSRWMNTPLHLHLNTTLPMMALIVVNVALVAAMRRHNRKVQFLLENSKCSSNFKSHESKLRAKERSLAVITLLIVTCFVVSILPDVSFHFVIIYFPEYQEQGWFFVGHRLFLTFVFLNPAVNPIIFNFRLAYFRRAFRNVFKSRLRARLQEIQLSSIKSSD